jgi:hypothetical protein
LGKKYDNDDNFTINKNWIQERLTVLREIKAGQEHEWMDNEFNENSLSKVKLKKF